MTKNSRKNRKAQSSLGFGRILMFVVLMLSFTAEIIAQDYHLTLNPRRLGNQLGVEVWIRTLNTDAPALGDLTIPVSCNGSVLAPAVPSGNQPSSTTDSVINDVNLASPYVVIASSFHNANGYIGLSASSFEDATASIGFLNARLAPTSPAGYRPSTIGRGSFIGMLRYDIKNASVLTDNDLAGFAINNTYAGDLIINSIAGINITSTVEVEEAATFTVRGITVLNPNYYQTINRYPAVPYNSMGSNLGYPIYFERSGLAVPSTTTGTYGTPRFAYQVSYSLDNGLVFQETGRIAESRLGERNLTTDALRNANYNGMLDFLSTSNDYYITTGSGLMIPNDVPSDSLRDAADGPGLVGVGYGGVLKIIWKNDQNFPYRSENALLRITQIATANVTNANTFAVNLASRDAYGDATRRGTSTASFVLGRIFFAQLDGEQCQYFKSERNFSTGSYLTVGAWINLNADNGIGTQPGVVASSSGDATGANGNGWILYLDDGIYPAFRISARDGGDIGTVRSPRAITVHNQLNADGNILMNDAHSANWTHVAAVVADNVITLYIDGEQVDQVINAGGPTVKPLETFMPIWVGVNPNSGFLAGADFLTAGLKEVQIWRTNLSQARLKQYISGVPFPTNATTDMTLSLDNPNVSRDVKQNLELYYNLQGIYGDIATARIQDFTNSLNYFVQCDATAGAQSTNLAITFRPDGAHIKLTSPSCGEGVSNLKGKIYEIRWASYGIGNSLPSASGEYGDVSILLTRDGGTNWFDAIGEKKYDSATGGTFAVSLDNEEVETGTAIWEPYNNVTLTDIANDIQGPYPTANNYAKTVRLRIQGTEGRMQNAIFAESGDFIVAPHFAFVNTPNARITIPGSQRLNISTTTAFMEAWIKPYSFPNADDGGRGSYPIIVKKDPTAVTDEEGLHYALRLLPTGQLEFTFASYDTASGVRDPRSVVSDPAKALFNPNQKYYDSIWYHVGVYLNLPTNGTPSSITFLIDGIAQTVDSIRNGLGSGIASEVRNTFPTYLGYEPFGEEDGSYFDGEIKEVRFWRNTPAGIRGENEPTDNGYVKLYTFIQGSSTVRATELIQVGSTNYAQGLIAAYCMDGGSWVNTGADNTIGVYPPDATLQAQIFSGCGEREYAATFPYIKLVEPEEGSQYANDDVVRVRWVGFDYNRNNLPSFTAGVGPRIKEADLALSDGSGGIGEASQNEKYYTPVAGVYDNTAFSNSMLLRTQLEEYEFLGAAERSQFAADVLLGIANPSAVIPSGVGQGPVDATQKNGRFRLWGRANINSPNPLEYSVNGVDDSEGLITTLRSEGPSFSITPQSNFTVRVLLEGYHSGTQNGIIGSLPSSGTADEKFRANGLRLRFYDENFNPVEPAIAVANKADYDPSAKNIANRQRGTNDFANVKFTLTEALDGNYYAVLEHQNYLPIMTAYPAKFAFRGESQINSWTIESGWDFSSWNGEDGNYLIQPAEGSIIFGTSYTAYADGGNYTADRVGNNYLTFVNTGLNFNDGNGSRTRTNGIAAMVGGDINKDGRIDGADRSALTIGAMSGDPRFNLKSTFGASNAVDRTILDNNLNKFTVLRNGEFRFIETDLYGSVENNGENGIITDASSRAKLSPNEINGFTSATGLENTFNSLNSLDGEGNFSAGGNNNKGSKNSNNGFQSGYVDYKVTAEIKKVPGTAFVDVEMHIQNIGETWNMANASFPIMFDEAVLGFVGLVKTTSTAFEALSLGYQGIYYAPTNTTTRPIASTYSIEINFDADYRQGNGYPGQEVPKAPTAAAYIGSLRFYLKDANADINITWDKDFLAVLSVDGRDLTGYGTFESIKPILIERQTTIISPSTGNKATAGLTSNITWTSDVPSARVNVQYKVDASNWVTINEEPFEITDFAYIWRTPDVHSDNCFVRIVNASTNKELAVSGQFAIEKIPTEITRPAEHNALYAANANDYIQWNTGEDVTVVFEFSENGINGWSRVAGPVRALDRQVAWTVKAVTSCEAVIRMVNAQTGAIMAVSTPFRIGTGTVALSTPEKGRKYKTGAKVQIKWTSKEVTSFDLEYSANSGASWATIANVRAADKSYTWTIPSNITSGATIRAISSSNRCLEYARTGLFSIVEEIPTSVEEPVVADGNAIVSISPNPVNDDATVRINLTREATVSAAIYDVRGLKVIDFADGVLLSAGLNDLVFNATNLSNGVYIVRIHIGGTIITKEFVKIK